MKDKNEKNQYSPFPSNLRYEGFEQYRSQLLQAATSDTQQMNVNRVREAKTKFNLKTGLGGAIAQKIFPSLVQIRTASGRTGIGFFQGNQWLISNAHVIQHQSDIIEGITLTDSKGDSYSLKMEQGYHRPYENLAAPDLVTCKTILDDRNFGVLPIEFPEDETYPDVLYFYVDANFTIRYLNAKSQDFNQVPIYFAPQDGHILEFGCSGTPVIAAKVILGRTPQWVFETIGALYARCPSSENPQEKWACVVPIKEELTQILKILQQLDSAGRHEQLANASLILRDLQCSQTHQRAGQQAQDLAERLLRQFETGDAPLDISLPDEMERLNGREVISVQCSLLPTCYPHIKQNDLEPLFLEFIQNQIQALELVTLADTDGLIVDSKNNWRVDCHHGKQDTYWLLQLQDNTSRGAKATDRKKSASSVLAQVEIPINIPYVKGEKLADGFLASQKMAHVKKEFDAAIAAATKSKNPKQAKELQNQKKALPSSIIIVGRTAGHTIKGYQTEPEPETIPSPSPRTQRVFEYLGDGFSKNQFEAAINVLPSEKKERQRRINAKHPVNGNTPLMELLADETLSFSPPQLNKAKTINPTWGFME